MSLLKLIFSLSSTRKQAIIEAGGIQWTGPIHPPPIPCHVIPQAITSFCLSPDHNIPRLSQFSLQSPPFKNAITKTCTKRLLAEFGERNHYKRFPALPVRIGADSDKLYWRGRSDCRPGQMSGKLFHRLVPPFPPTIRVCRIWLSCSNVLV
ncbi:hypothetical protein BaRGS_00004552 [Batillaria attramentaria]|uniref:Uncharacterized protein n=1 Tax=Batillaria attramentaria TaxID=370345 RepID=A0ABD0LXS9_9CAEN